MRERYFRGNRGAAPIVVVLIVVLVLAAAAGIGVFVGHYTTRYELGATIREVFEQPFDGKRSVYILMLGEDNSQVRNKQPSRGLCDTIILMRVDLANKRVAALSIPRDTRVNLSGYYPMKINATHVVSGPVLTQMAVRQLVGIQPDYYVKTGIDGFIKTVDILGGVEFDVERNMKYTDRWGGLYIDLKKGRQMLDGDKAAQYVRFRHDAMGDLNRIQRQQAFLKALAKKALSPVNLPKLPRIMEAVLENMESDLTVKEAIYLAKLASEIDMDEVKTAMLPGEPRDIGGISYWIASPRQTAGVVDDLFFPRPQLPSVEVLNGTGVPGTAHRVAEMLKEHGYEIAAVGNAESFDCTRTEIIGHKEQAQGEDQIASILSVGHVKRNEESSSSADVTVIIGKDYVLAHPGS